MPENRFHPSILIIILSTIPLFEYPFNFGELKVPLHATKSENLLFVPDFDNLEQVSAYLNNNVELIK